jgi:hypothetical protein
MTAAIFKPLLAAVTDWCPSSTWKGPVFVIASSCNSHDTIGIHKNSFLKFVMLKCGQPENGGRAVTQAVTLGLLAAKAWVHAE